MLKLLFLRIDVEKYRQDKSLFGRLKYLYKKYKYTVRLNDLTEYILEVLNNKRKLYDVIDEFIHSVNTIQKMNPYYTFKDSNYNFMAQGNNQITVLIDIDKRFMISLIRPIKSVNIVFVESYGFEQRATNFNIGYDDDPTEDFEADTHINNIKKFCYNYILNMIGRCMRKVLLDEEVFISAKR